MTEPAPEQLECVEVVITAESAEWLADFTRSLVEDRLVACGHNIAPIRAIYRWEGKVYDEAQARVALHTRASLVTAIVDRTDRYHSDDLPCVIAVPIISANAKYLTWIFEETEGFSAPSVAFN
ncbi:MAG: divalent-cation tolerance protein CutA [Pseudonocardia sp.]